MNEVVLPQNNKILERSLAILVIAVPTLLTVFALITLKWRPLTWLDISLFLGFYVFTSLGVTLGYHRLLTHNAFKCSRFIKMFFAICAAMSAQGPAIWWVAHHRKHHAFSDKEHDVHSPLPKSNGKFSKFFGFIHGHMSWMLEGHPTQARKYAGALMNDPDIKKIDSLYLVWVALSLILPALCAVFVTFAIGLVPAISGELAFSEAVSRVLPTLTSAALGGLLWGGFVRIFVLHHATWSVNSVCHLFGRVPFKSTDCSKNNAIVAALTMGEGWHNGHHAFPTSARHGLLAGEIDVTWMLIRFFEKVGLAWDIKLPTAVEIERHLIIPNAKTANLNRPVLKVD